MYERDMDEGISDDIQQVTFTKHYDRFNPGEVAGYEHLKAQELVMLGIADYTDESRAKREGLSFRPQLDDGRPSAGRSMQPNVSSNAPNPMQVILPPVPGVEALDALAGFTNDVTGPKVEVPPELNADGTAKNPVDVVQTGTSASKDTSGVVTTPAKPAAAASTGKANT